MFSLDILNVYDKAPASAASLAQHSWSWNKRHAVANQLLRVSESLFVLNMNPPPHSWMPPRTRMDLCVALTFVDALVAIFVVRPRVHRQRWGHSLRQRRGSDAHSAGNLFPLWRADLAVAGEARYGDVDRIESGTLHPANRIAS